MKIEDAIKKYKGRKGTANTNIRYYLENCQDDITLAGDHAEQEIFSLQHRGTGNKHYPAMIATYWQFVLECGGPF